jgi:Putative Ig domain
MWDRLRTRIAGPLVLGLTLAALAGCNSEDAATQSSSDTGTGSATGTPLAEAAKKLVNSAPAVTGSPKTSVLADADFRFVPRASDSNGDVLTWSIQNKPAWATFDSFSGALMGHPTSSDIGTYEGIAITVSDGSVTIPLEPFSLTVISAGTAAVTITWLPPAVNDDGTPLTDLAGYFIYYGTDPNSLENVRAIHNMGISSHVIDGLVPGQWHFAIKSYNTAGIESDLSGVIGAEVS